MPSCDKKVGATEVAPTFVIIHNGEGCYLLVAVWLAPVERVTVAV